MKRLPEIWLRLEDFIQTGISWDATEESCEREVFITVMQVQARSFI